MRMFSITDVPLHPAPDDAPARFAADSAPLGTAAGAKSTDVFIAELDPGQSHWPYHYELELERWLLIVHGEATVRTPAGEVHMTTGDLCFFPAGPDGALEVRNTSTGRTRLMLMGEVSLPCVTIYPDSDKVGVWMRDEELVVQRKSGVHYFHDET